MVKADLPDLFPFHGDWEKYVDELYEIYLREIVNGGLTFKSLPIRCRYHPKTRGKGYGFWHIIQEGRIEEERLPDFRRCERIHWISWVIKNADIDERISWWEEKRRTNTDILLWLEDEDYLVVLAKRRNYLLLKTAYYITKRHKRATLYRNRNKFWKSKKG